MLVFLHLPITQRALERALSDALPGIRVRAVGRIADFERALSAGEDGVLTLPVVHAAKGLKPGLRGSRNGSTNEPYAIVGTDFTPDPKRVSVVGALDLLGRSGTASFIDGILGSGPKLERVGKVEDLLALLQMQRVEAIILPARLVSGLRSMSRLNLVERQLDKQVELPAVAGTGPAAAALMQAIESLDRGTLGLLGVDVWR